MTNPEPSVIKTVPTCYRHADRETRISCGRCGVPLCPDCVMHGPVGVRCRECLSPQGKGPGSTLDAKHLAKATIVAMPVSIGWVILIAVISLLTTEYTRVPVANVLLSGAAGGMVGWIIWRICQRTWNAKSIRLAIVLGGAIPLIATLIVTGAIILLTGNVSFLNIVFLIRLLSSIGVSVLMAWLLATNTM